MKIITKKINVYQFEDLSKKSKEKAIYNHYEQEDYPFLSEELDCQFTELNQYFIDQKIYYSLSYCQGDGLSFSAQVDLNIYLKLKYPNMKVSVSDVLCNYVTFFSTGNADRNAYGHKNQVDAALDSGYSHNIFRIEKLVHEILEDIKEDYMSICNSLEKYGYGILEYRMSFDEFQEFCESNEYNFDVDGKMINEAV